MKKKPVYTRYNKKVEGPASHADLNTERNFDEQIHLRGSDLGRDDNDDPDNRVHTPKREKNRQFKAEDHSNDPDDLVHENGDENEEY